MPEVLDVPPLLSCLKSAVFLAASLLQGMWWAKHILLHVDADVIASLQEVKQASTTKVLRLCIFTQGGYDFLCNIVEMSLIFSCSKSLWSFWMMQDFFSFVSFSPTAPLCSIDW